MSESIRLTGCVKRVATSTNVLFSRYSQILSLVLFEDVPEIPMGHSQGSDAALIAKERGWYWWLNTDVTDANSDTFTWRRDACATISLSYGGRISEEGKERKKQAQLSSNVSQSAADKEQRRLLEKLPTLSSNSRFFQEW